MNDSHDSGAGTHPVNVNTQNQFVVWPMQLQTRSGCRRVGMEGTRRELDVRLRRLVAETLLVPLPIADRRALDTRWD